MTYKEKLAQEQPSMIDEECVGGVNGCPHTYGYENYRLCTSNDDIKCAECWNREIPGTEKILSPAEKEDPLNEKIDIHKIIDDAMKKKDRTVSIYIWHGGGVSINIQPYETEPARWIYRPDEINYDFECSACGTLNDFESLYCPFCGEQMKKSKEEDEDDG